MDVIILIIPPGHTGNFCCSTPDVIKSTDTVFNGDTYTATNVLVKQTQYVFR